MNVNLSTNRNPTATKKGPGRFHQQGHKKATPVAQKGAPMGFVLHTASAKKLLRRAYVATFGRRQANKDAKRERRMPLPAGFLDDTFGA